MKLLWDYKDLIGEKVIHRSNENEEYEIGTLIGFNEHGIPIVRFDSDGTEYTCCGCVMPYVQEIIDALVTRSPQQQYDYCRYFTLFFSLLSSAHRNPKEIRLS
jgi:hypothetical protein